MFSLLTTCALGRRGRLTTGHGVIETPFFLPVATAGAMKGMGLPELAELGAQVLLCNTYHLHLHPGGEVVSGAGGLHRFIGWDKPILTDSGGFQVFSLKAIRSVSDAGVQFRSHRSGDLHFIGPAESIAIQHALGADILMCFDECPPSTAPRTEQIAAVDRTLQWAKVCKQTHKRLCRDHSSETTNARSPHSSLSRPLLFGIVQGGLERDLREKCAGELCAIGFDGYAIGGLAVGESEAQMMDIVELVCPLLPHDKPRYLMGVGGLAQQRAAVALGIDMFDCVSPMREARHGNIWLTGGAKLRIQRAEFLRDHTAIDPDSPSPLSRRHTRSYLHHLMKLGERYGETIACQQNMAVTLKAMADIRSAIEHSGA